ncbi:MAG: M3 family metallopeptidase [bacterium]
MKSTLSRRLAPALVLALLPLSGALAADPAPLIDYTTVNADVIERECANAMAKSDEILAKMVAVPKGKRSFENTMRPLDESDALQSEAFGKYAFFAYVAPDSGLREVARAQEETLNKYQLALGFREDIYDAVKAYSETPEAKGLAGERARYLAFTLRDYRRNGFGKSKQVRDEVKKLQARLVELGEKFQKTIADWQDGIEVPPDRAGGLPANYLAGLKKKDDGNYWVSLDYPERYPFLDYADDADLRKSLTEKSWNMGYPDNVQTLEEAIAIRDRVAKLLGYESWAAYRMEPRMAKDPEAVRTFLEDLRHKIRPKFEADLARMKATVAKNDPSVDYWDWAYYNSKEMTADFHVDPTEVSKYFPLQRVLDGMFSITQEMFGLKYVEIPKPAAWDADVQLFEIHDAASGELLAYFYTDLFPREGKYSHAAAFPLRSGGGLGLQRTLPVSAIVANLTKPTADTPSLLRHEEVETLFHEFGHVLHQTLTKAEFRRFAGSNTEQDFVEAPSQNLEHWVWQPEVLDRFAAHYQTGEKIPRDMLQGMIAAKQLNSGIKWLRQVLYAELDLTYHGPGEKKDTTKLLNELHPICGFPNMPGTHMQAGFGHLFGYDAAYYGYLWSKVYGDDMFTAFEQGGILNPEVGMRYRREIYERGGTKDGADLVRAFLGREPNDTAFLKDLGLTVASAGSSAAGASAAH